MAPVDERLKEMLAQAAQAPGPVVVLTGGGISAESGVPTFRGDDGEWQVGSRRYRPVELATWMAFQRMPADIWAWYLYRRATYRAATPNAAHLAIAELERRLGDRFLLVTENVHGLHLRAGNTLARTHQIHGNADYARCASDCNKEIVKLPDDFAVEWRWPTPLGTAETRALTCQRCGGWMRPHVLWMDEAYDEEHFRFDSSLRAASEASALVIIGATAAAALPMKMCQAAVARGVLMIAIAAQDTPLTEMAAGSRNGHRVQGTIADMVPPTCQAIAETFSVAR